MSTNWWSTKVVLPITSIQQSTILHHGFVLKKGEQLLTGWKQRYLVLYSNKKLNYFIDETKEMQKGFIDISLLNTDDIQQSSNSAFKSNFGFCIQTINRKWEFSVSTAKERNDWISSIKQSLMVVKQVNTMYNEDEEELRYAHRSKYKRNKLKIVSDDNVNSNTSVHSQSEQLQMEMKSIDDKISSKLNEALRISHETENIACDSAVKLDGQRTNLLKIDRDLHGIDDHLNTSAYILNGMQSFTGMIANKFKSKPNQNEYKSPVNYNKSNMNGNVYNQNTNVNNHMLDGSGILTNNGKHDEALDNILKSVKRIHAMSDDINIELDEQNIILSSIDQRMDACNSKLQKQTNKIKRIN